MKIGTAIRRLRISLGIKQEELAAALDVSQSFLSKVESNKSKLYVDDLVRIAEYTNTPIINFFSEQSEEENLEQERNKREELLVLLRANNDYLQKMIEKEV